MLRVALAVAVLAITLLGGDLQAQESARNTTNAVADKDAGINDRTTTMTTGACQPVALCSQRPSYQRGHSWRRLEGRYSADKSWSGQPWGWESSYGYTSLAGYGWRWDHTVAGRTGYRNSCGHGTCP